MLLQVCSCCYKCALLVFSACALLLSRDTTLEPDTLFKASRDPDTLCKASLVARHDTWDLQVANSIGALNWKSTQCVVLFVFPACTPFSSRSTRHVRLATSVLACQWRSTRCSAFVVCVVSIARLGRMVQHGVFSVVTGLYRCSFFRFVTIRRWTVTTKKLTTRARTNNPRGRATGRESEVFKNLNSVFFTPLLFTTTTKA